MAAIGFDSAVSSHLPQEQPIHGVCISEQTRTIIGHPGKNRPEVGNKQVENPPPYEK
jgi:hypothetical protein